MMFSQHYILALSSPLHKASASPSGSMQGVTIEDEGANGHGSNGSDDSNNIRSRIAHSRKFEHGYSHGKANGGRSIGFGEKRSRGGSQSPYRGGSRSPYRQGSTFVPVYAAGSANNHRRNNHHSAGNKKFIGLPTLFASTGASLVHLYMAFGCRINLGIII